MNKALTIQFKIAELFKKLAMEGTDELDSEVEAFAGKASETNGGKKIFSAMVKIATRYAQILSQNFGYNSVSFKMKFEGKE